MFNVKRYIAHPHQLVRYMGTERLGTEDLPVVSAADFDHQTSKLSDERDKALAKALHSQQAADKATQECKSLEDWKNQLCYQQTQLRGQKRTLQIQLDAEQARSAELVSLLNLLRDEDGTHYTDALKARISAALVAPALPTESGECEECGGTGDGLDTEQCLKCQPTAINEVTP